jgi:hypothetical protein
MEFIRSRTFLCALAAALLSGCGGDGGGSGGTGGDTDLVNNTLQVSLSYGNATVPLFGARPR